jgi:Phage integrase, N-terminal SAM-like domain
VVEFFERCLRHIKASVSPRTHERYEQIAMKNIAPLIGAKVLSKLKPIEISEGYSQALESGRRDGKGGLSPQTVHHMHRVLFSALDQAERWKMVPRNPAALLEKRTAPKSSAGQLRRSTPMQRRRPWRRPVNDACSSHWCWPPSADCAAAKLVPCAGGPSTLTADSLPSWRAPNRPMPAESAKRKPRAAGRGP